MESDRVKIVSRLIAENTYDPVLKRKLLHYSNDIGLSKALSVIAEEYFDKGTLGELKYYALLDENKRSGRYTFFNTVDYKRFNIQVDFVSSSS